MAAINKLEIVHNPKMGLPIVTDQNLYKVFIGCENICSQNTYNASKSTTRYKKKLNLFIVF